MHSFPAWWKTGLHLHLNGPGCRQSSPLCGEVAIERSGAGWFLPDPWPTHKSWAHCCACNVATAGEGPSPPGRAEAVQPQAGWADPLQAGGRGEGDPPPCSQAAGLHVGGGAASAEEVTTTSSVPKQLGGGEKEVPAEFCRKQKQRGRFMYLYWESPILTALGASGMWGWPDCTPPLSIVLQINYPIKLHINPAKESSNILQLPAYVFSQSSSQRPCEADQ